MLLIWNVGRKNVFFVSLIAFTIVLFIISSIRWLCASFAKENDSLDKPVLPQEASSFAKCGYYDCFDAYKCGKDGKQKILVYIYPPKRYGQVRSKEFAQILNAIRHSHFYTPDAEKACIFVPSIDTLNGNQDEEKLAQTLTSLPFWNGGENHLIFNMMPRKQGSLLPVGKAMIAGASFDSWTYRGNFDVSLPVFSPYASSKSVNRRDFLLVSSQFNLHPEFSAKIKAMASDMRILTPCVDIDQLKRCHGNVSYSYPDVLSRANFCVVLRALRLAQPVLLEALAAGCVPIILADTLVMPFNEVIDWKRAAIFVPENGLDTIKDVARSVHESRWEVMSQHCVWLYETYFSSMERITHTVLKVLNHRVFPENALPYEDWNLKPNAVARNPLFLNKKASERQGFTAVILAYERIDSLFRIIGKLDSVSSLAKVIVVWNNPRKSPPPSEDWPKIGKTIKLVRTSSNKFSNRFLPFEEIKTEAVLSLDDDITMLTDDELDFGFEVWREYPDRIVGFPSRTHIWDNRTNSWKYESEWTNEISMVLTGAAFYHKYWNYLYTNAMPGNIKKWVDDRFNCEDIAMNFLVTNVTNKAPIKVTPRKKFKCPECKNTEMLSADLGHMMIRTECVNEFSRIYGRMPLKSVEFRADPVLYKDNFPLKLKRYLNIGSL